MRGTTTDPAAILGQLAQVSTQIHAAGSPNAILELIAHQAREIIGAHQAIAGLTMDEAWARGTQAVSPSEKYAQWRRLVESSAGTALYSQMCRQNRSIRLTQAALETHPVWKDFGQERHLSMRGWLAAPLISRYGRKLGLIQLSDKYDGEFMPVDETILVQLAHMAAIAIENVRLLKAARAAERRFNDFRRLVMRYERRLDIHLAFTKLAAALITFRQMERLC
jgi:GAF domain-containing protein